MTEIPMLFCAEMVRALLAGTKTQTRRIKFSGKRGDRIWGREACLIDGWYDGSESNLPLVTRTGPDGEAHTILYRVDCPDLRAIDDDGGQKYRSDGTEASIKWKPSIFMPRWASRILLEVEDVREQWLQKITNGDAESEGIRRKAIPADEHGPRRICFVTFPDNNHAYATAREAFEKGWDLLNAKRGYSWASNPVVKAITFRRIA